MSLAPYVRILGRGPGRSRSLTQAEAAEAMEIILAGQPAPEAVGALLMLLRMKGETAEELAGFVAAARTRVGWSGTAPALDWPSYAAGRTRGLPRFLLAAKIVARAGFPVLLHGWNSHQQNHASVRAALGPLGIGKAGSVAEASDMLAAGQIAYVPLEQMSEPLFALLRLRDDLGLRSCINTVLRMLNPGVAGASVQGVFHPTYRETQTQAALLLGDRAASVIKGGGGEFEVHPGKALEAYGLRNGQVWHDSFAATWAKTQKLNEGPTEPGHLSALWDGAVSDPFAEAVVLRTAALALGTLGVADPHRLSIDIWRNRHQQAAA